MLNPSTPLPPFPSWFTQPSSIPVQPHSACPPMMKAYLGLMRLGPPPGVTRCLLLVVTTGPLTGSPPAASWRRKGGSTPAQRPARARASFSRGRPAQPAPPTSTLLTTLVEMRNPYGKFDTNTSKANTQIHKYTPAQRQSLFLQRPPSTACCPSFLPQHFSPH